MHLGKIAKQLLGAAAPLLGTAFGGPFGTIAGSMVSKALGVSADKIEEIIANPTAEQLVQLRTAEQDFKKFMAESGIKRSQLAQKDRESARQLAINTTLAPQITLGVIFVLGYFALVMGLLIGVLTLPENSRDLVAGLIGVLTAGVIKVLDFFLGSSAGSKMKTLLNNKAPST